VVIGARDRAGALLHRPAIGLVERGSGCFADQRRADLVDHDVITLVMQRVFGVALDYEATLGSPHGGRTGIWWLEGGSAAVTERPARTAQAFAGSTAGRAASNALNAAAPC
jgi:hypothetical protein